MEAQDSIIPLFDDSSLYTSELVINDGGIQRSRILSIDVYFANAYLLAPIVTTGGITITNASSVVVQTGATGAHGLITVSTSQGNIISSAITLTFSNEDTSDVTAGVEYGSLADGRWDMVVSGGTAPTQFTRLFGDSDGNATIDGSDYGDFGGAMGTNSAQSGYRWYFDWNGEGAIDGLDFAEFGNRFGHSV